MAEYLTNYSQEQIRSFLERVLSLPPDWRVPLFEEWKRYLRGKRAPALADRSPLTQEMQDYDRAFRFLFRPAQYKVFMLLLKHQRKFGCQKDLLLYEIEARQLHIKMLLGRFDCWYRRFSSSSARGR